MGFWSTIRAAFGGNSDSLNGGTIAPDQSLSMQATRYYSAVNPELISNYIASAQNGNIRGLVDLAQSYRSKDGHIQGCFSGLELSIKKLPWASQPIANGKTGNPRKRDQKLCQQVDAAIDGIAGFKDAIAHLVGSAEMHGHATIEFTGWNLYAGKNPLLRGWMVPAKAEIINANRFGFRQADSRLLFDVRGFGDVNYGGLDLLADFPAGKFAQHRPRITGAVPSREGLDELIVWHGFFRNFGVKDWVLSAESGWKPTRIVTYKKGGTGTEDKALALSLAERLIASGGAAIPDSLAVEVFFPKNGSSSQQAPHRVLCEYLGNELSKATLGHTLLLESGDKGARSLGEVGYTVATERRDARAMTLAETLNAQLVQPLVAMNVAGANAPLYLPEIKNQVDLIAFANAVDILAKRMRVPASYVREMSRVAEPKADEEILTMGAQPVDPNAAQDAELDIPITVDGEDATDSADNAQD